MLNLTQLKYYVLDEEEIGLTFQKKIAEYRSPNKNFSKIIKKKFVFNPKIKKIYSKFLPKEKIVVSGNPKVQLCKEIHKKKRSRKIFLL